MVLLIITLWGPRDGDDRAMHDQKCNVRLRNVDTISGGFRAGDGSDVLRFYGPNAVHDAQRPVLVLQVSGQGPTSSILTPLPPVSKVGTVVNGSTTTIEATCDGGT